MGIIEGLLSYDEQLCDERWFHKRNAILKRDSYRCRMCGKTHSVVSHLQVHHRYYVKNYFAWDYDESALVTLCEDCHQLVHRTIPPINYKSFNNQIIPSNLTPCKRCGGKGYFKEFNHIQNGICFRCQGNKYEELLPNSHVDFSTYYMTDKTIFDILHPLLDDKMIQSLFEEGKNYQFGVDGHAFNANKAYLRYKEAALNGFGKAQNNCGVMIKMGVYNLREDIETAIRWFVYAAQQGIYQAQSNLAEIYENGKLVPKSTELASAWGTLAELNMKEEHDVTLAKKIVEAVQKGSLETIVAYCLAFKAVNSKLKQLKMDVISHKKAYCIELMSSDGFLGYYNGYNADSMTISIVQKPLSGVLYKNLKPAMHSEKRVHLHFTGYSTKVVELYYTLTENYQLKEILPDEDGKYNIKGAFVVELTDPKDLDNHKFIGEIGKEMELTHNIQNAKLFGNYSKAMSAIHKMSFLPANCGRVFYRVKITKTRTLDS